MFTVTEPCKRATWIHSELPKRSNRSRSCLALPRFGSSELNFELIIGSCHPKNSSYPKLISREKFWMTDHNCNGNVRLHKLLANKHKPGCQFRCNTHLFILCFRDGNSFAESKRSKPWSHSRFTFCSFLANVRYIKCLLLGSSNKMTFSGLIFFFFFLFFHFLICSREITDDLYLVSKRDT